MKYVLVAYHSVKGGAVAWTLTARNGTEAYDIAKHHLLREGLYSESNVLSAYQVTWMLIPSSGEVTASPKLRII